MSFLTYVPRPPLAALIERFWHCEGTAPPHRRERVLPTGTTQFVISLCDQPLRDYETPDAEAPRTFRGPLACGPRSEFAIIDTSSQLLSVGVQFRPGGAMPFLGLPAGELHNVNVPLTTLWGKKADELHGRLLEARTPAARFLILEQFLLARAGAPCKHHPAVMMALEEFRSFPWLGTIADVTTHVGLSSRRFIQLFHRQVGLTPKLYCRIQRFQAALSLTATQQHPDWVTLGLACGYFDQAHFIRDFQAFTGMCPTDYLAHRGEHQNHVVLSEPGKFRPIQGGAFSSESVGQGAPSKCSRSSCQGPPEQKEASR